MSYSTFPTRDFSLDMRFLRAVEAAIQAQDIPRAVAMARQGLADGLVHPMLLNLRAFSYENEGRNDDALRDLHHAAEIAPDDPTVQNAYGLILARMQKTSQAIAAFERTIRLAPDFPQAHFNLGWAKETTGDLVGGQKSLEDAVSLKPDFADAWARLAQIAFRRGDFAKATEWAERALSADPKQNFALNTLAQTALALGDFDGADSALARALSDPGILPLNRTQARSIQGDLLHARGRFAEAFAAYKAANDEEHAIYAPQFDAPGAETAYTYSVWSAEYFETAPAEEWSAQTALRTLPDSDPIPAKGHVFLVGFPRSGTTLLENILSSHPEIVALEEKPTLSDATRAFFDNAAGRERLRRLSPPDAAAQRGTYWGHVREFGAAPDAKVLIDKNPLNSIKLPIIARLFPSAKILFALRDPRDVVLSCYRRSFLMNSSMYEFTTLERCARFYDAVMRLAQIYRKTLGQDWYEVRHETLIDDFEGETRKVCDFIGVAWSSEMSDFAERAKSRAIATPSSIQVMRGLNRDGVGYWRNYRDQMEPVLPVLAPWVEKFGYAKD